MIPGSFFSQCAWLDFRNDSASPVPACGIVRATGVVVVSAGELTVISTTQPASYGDVGACFINGPASVPGYDGTTYSYGRCTRSGIVVALYDSASGTPVYGDLWGPISGSSKMSAYGQGWISLGAPTNTAATLAMFAPAPITMLRGIVTGGSIAAGATGTVEVYYRSGTTTYTDTTQAITALNDLNTTIAIGVAVRCVPEPYVVGATATQGWAIIQANCAP